MVERAIAIDYVRDLLKEELTNRAAMSGGTTHDRTLDGGPARLWVSGTINLDAMAMAITDKLLSFE